MSGFDHIWRRWTDSTIQLDAPRCKTCRQPMTCGQPGRHWSCSPTCERCHRPHGPNHQNCQCGHNRKKETTT
jgi:hypothetical protein